MSHLQNKSEMLSDAAKLLHDKTYYSAVAHSAYYSCYQLLKHIWLYSMGKTENELGTGISTARIGSHEYLINQTVHYIENSKKKDCINHARIIGNTITQLKKMRTNADYSDTLFDSSKSSISISLSDDIIPILKKY
jgi:hypothetical protein